MSTSQGELHQGCCRRTRTSPRVGRQVLDQVLEDFPVEAVDKLESVCGTLRIKAQA